MQELVRIKTVNVEICNNISFAKPILLYECPSLDINNFTYSRIAAESSVRELALVFHRHFESRSG